MRTIEEAIHFIQQHADLGPYVRVEIDVCRTGHAEPHARADEIARQRGLTAPGRLGWRELSRDAAIEQLTRMLHRTLAYRIPLLQEKTARHLARTLISGMDRDADFVSSGTYDDRGNLQWTPLSDATFEIALVCCDGNRAVFFHAKDDD